MPGTVRTSGGLPGAWYRWHRRWIAGWLTTALVGAPMAARAQDRPVVFVHGFMSDGTTWAGAASRLQAGLALVPATPTVSSPASYESQAAELQSQFGALGPDVVAVGHSNGGLVSRQWSRQHPVSAIVTVGTPHHGAPLVRNLYAYAGVNNALLASFNDVYRLFAQGCCNWHWILSAYTGVWQLVASATLSALPRVASVLALSGTVPVSVEMQPGSTFLHDINGAANLSREAAHTPGRVGIVSTAYHFYYGGPLRAAYPDDGDALYVLREVARVGMEVYAGYIYAHAPFDEWWAFDIADGMMAAAFYLGVMDEFWCRAVSDVGMQYCAANDTIVPYWSQQYPGAAVINTGWYGPAHTQQTRMSDALLEPALLSFAGVRRRGETPPPVPPVDPGPEVRLYQHIGFAGTSFGSATDQSYVGSAWNDVISSVHVPDGRTVLLFEHADFRGQSLTLTGDADDLRDYPGPGLDGTWNDAVSAIRIE